MVIPVRAHMHLLRPRMRIIPALFVPFVHVLPFTLSARSMYPDVPQYPIEGSPNSVGLAGVSWQQDELGSSIGLCAALEIEERLAFGIYLEGLAYPADVFQVPVNDSLRSAKAAFFHGGIFVRYAFNTSGAIHPFLVARSGWGSAAWNFSWSEAQSSSTNEVMPDGVLMFMPSMGVEFTIARRIRPSVHIGYRLVSGLALPGMNSNCLNAPYVGFAVLLDLFSE